MIPTQEGFYWARWEYKTVGSEYEMVEVTQKDNGDFDVWAMGWHLPLRVEDYHHWIGPLTPPNKGEKNE